MSARMIISAVALLVGIAGTACQAGPPVQGSILDGCARPTAANQDWCLSTQHPNIK